MKSKIRIYSSLLFGLIPINFLKIFLLRIVGHEISFSSRIGLSVILVEKLELAPKSKIGNFNFIRINKVVLKESSFIGHFNYFKGDFELHLESEAGISLRNKIRRSYPPVVYGKSYLQMGANSFIVSDHFLDLTRTISLGSNSILAGIKSQLWTHGYYHANKGKDRIRIDGEIHISDNVYIGSGCIFNPGISVSHSIHIGAGSVISKSLEMSGMYVGQGLRFIENDFEKVKSKLRQVDGFELIENVYEKR